MDSWKQCAIVAEKAGGVAWNHPRDVSVLTMDYFSEKDGQVHHLICVKNVYDELVSGFKIPVDREEQIELL